MQITTVGLDLAKRIFQVHAVDASGDVVVRKALRRSQVLPFFTKLPPCLIGMEACHGGAHSWAREIAALGHEVRLIPPAYVKPYVKRGKKDAADAEAICEAVTRPTWFVPVKSAEQQAARRFTTRDLLVKQRTEPVNTIRGLSAELGIMPEGLERAQGGAPDSREEIHVGRIGNGNADLCSSATRCSTPMPGSRLSTARSLPSAERMKWHAV